MEKEKKESGADMSEKGFEAERMFLAVKIAKRKGDAGSILALEREIRENPAYEEYFRKSGEKIVFDKEFLTDDSMVNIVDFVRYVSKEDIQQKCKNEEYKKKFISDFKTVD
jgi:hypothetical protein